MAKTIDAVKTAKKVKKISAKVVPTRSAIERLLDSAWDKRVSLKAAIRRLPEWRTYQSAVADCRKGGVEPTLAIELERVIGL